MVSFSRILCVIDPTSREQPALARAAWYSRQTGAALKLLICYHNEYLDGMRFFDAPSLLKMRNEALASLVKGLDSLAAPYRDEGLPISTHAVWDHPLHEGIVRQAASLEADVIFKDTHHHNVLARSLFTNSDWNLIRQCPVPLWLVKPNQLDQNPQVVAAIDPLNDHDKPASLDGAILELSESVASEIGGDAHAFHSYDPSGLMASTAFDLYAPAIMPLDELEQQMRESHQGPFDDITARYGFPTHRKHLLSGAVEQELPQLAKELNAAIVVMGAVSRKRLERLFIGATAERSLERLPCDLLIVKPAWVRESMHLQVTDAA